jgi:hypothetical protein
MATLSHALRFASTCLNQAGVASVGLAELSAAASDDGAACPLMWKALHDLLVASDLRSRVSRRVRPRPSWVARGEDLRRVWDQLRRQGKVSYPAVVESCQAMMRALGYRVRPFFALTAAASSSRHVLVALGWLMARDGVLARDTDTDIGAAAATRAPPVAQQRGGCEFRETEEVGEVEDCRPGPDAANCLLWWHGRVDRNMGAWSMAEDAARSMRRRGKASGKTAAGASGASVGGRYGGNSTDGGAGRSGSRGRSGPAEGSAQQCTDASPSELAACFWAWMEVVLSQCEVDDHLQDEEEKGSLGGTPRSSLEACPVVPVGSSLERSLGGSLGDAFGDRPRPMSLVGLRVRLRDELHSVEDTPWVGFTMPPLQQPLESGRNVAHGDRGTRESLVATIGASFAFIVHALLQLMV